MPGKPLYRSHVANEVSLKWPILERVPEQKREYFSRIVSRLLEKDEIKNVKITVRDIDPQNNILETEDEDGIRSRNIQDTKFDLQRWLLYDVVQRSYHKKTVNTWPLSHTRAPHPFKIIVGWWRKISAVSPKPELIIISEETRNKNVISILQSLFPEINISHLREITSMHYNIVSPHDSEKFISFVKIFDEQWNISSDLIKKWFDWDSFIWFIERRIKPEKIEWIFLSNDWNIKITYWGTVASYQISN